MLRFPRLKVERLLVGSNGAKRADDYGFLSLFDRVNAVVVEVLFLGDLHLIVAGIPVFD